MEQFPSLTVSPDAPCEYGYLSLSLTSDNSLGILTELLALKSIKKFNFVSHIDINHLHSLVCILIMFQSGQTLSELTDITHMYNN